MTPTEQPSVTRGWPGAKSHEKIDCLRVSRKCHLYATRRTSARRTDEERNAPHGVGSTHPSRLFQRVRLTGCSLRNNVTVLDRPSFVISYGKGNGNEVVLGGSGRQGRCPIERKCCIARWLAEERQGPLMASGGQKQA